MAVFASLLRRGGLFLEYAADVMRVACSLALVRGCVVSRTMQRGSNPQQLVHLPPSGVYSLTGQFSRQKIAVGLLQAQARGRKAR